MIPSGNDAAWALATFFGQFIYKKQMKGKKSKKKTKSKKESVSGYQEEKETNL